jgi:hypothetical protein
MEQIPLKQGLWHPVDRKTGLSGRNIHIVEGCAKLLLAAALFMFLFLMICLQQWILDAKNLAS